MDGAKRWGRGGCSLGLDVVNFLVNEYNRRYRTGLDKANVPIWVYLSPQLRAASPQPCCRHGGGRVWWRRGGGTIDTRPPAAGAHQLNCSLGHIHDTSWHIVTSSHVGAVTSAVVKWEVMLKWIIIWVVGQQQKFKWELLHIWINKYYIRRAW